jgi:hypothetical protein
MTAFWDVALMMETVRTSEILINSYQATRRNIPEDSHLFTRRRENLKSQHDYVASQSRRTQTPVQFFLRAVLCMKAL